MGNLEPSNVPGSKHATKDDGNAPDSELQTLTARVVGADVEPAGDPSGTRAPRSATPSFHTAIESLPDMGTDIEQAGNVLEALSLSDAPGEDDFVGYGCVGVDA